MDGSPRRIEMYFVFYNHHSHHYFHVFVFRDTPTSAGPKSYNKGKDGFVNKHKQFELSMKPRTHLEKQVKYDG